MDLPPVIAAEQAIAQQNIALSVIKQSAQADGAIASVLEESAQALSAGVRGTSVDIKA